MTVAELLARMSSHELSEWMAYYEIEPFGDERADLRNAINTSTIVNQVRALGGSRKQTKATDFLPFKDEPTPDTQDLYSKVRGNPAFQPPKKRPERRGATGEPPVAPDP